MDVDAAFPAPRRHIQEAPAEAARGGVRLRDREDAVERLKALGKPAGILTGNEEEARRYIAWGYLFVAVGADVGLLAKNADALAKKFKA